MWPLAGHDRIVTYLKRSLEKGVLSHAYLFTGPQGVGKMTAALFLAQAVNCPAADKPCCECPSCLKIAVRNHPDIQVLKLLTADETEDKKAKSEIVIEQVRDLQHWACLPPYEGRCRVFIFEQAELMNEAAANCLLKTLEEPLPNVLLILLAPSLGVVPETIISRCQHLAFRPVKTEIIEGLLLDRGVSTEQANLLAHLAGGAPGWALTALENDEVLTQRKERLELLLGLIGCGYEERFEAAEELAGKGASGRNDATGLIRDWQGLWRDLLLIKAGGAEGVINRDYQDRITATCDKLDINNIRSFLSDLTKAEKLVDYNVNTRLILETLMLDMPLVDKAKPKRVI